MTKHLYTQNIDTAFQHAVGGNGADENRFACWLDALVRIIRRMAAHPKKEAEAIFTLPSRTDDLAEIETIVEQITQRFDTLIVAGMGGSSLSGETLASIRKPGGLTLRFIDNIDPDGISELLETIEWRSTAFLVISKSGHTVESLAQMAMLLRAAKDRLQNYAEHFYIITMTNGNPLHTLAKKHGMRLVAHDPALGGRFSIFSAVGLIPALAAGVDIRTLRAGAQTALEENFIAGELAPAAQSAALHLALMEKNIHANVLLHYSDRLGGLANWYRQCWAESLGKCNKATLPVRARGATDQHSQLQLYLGGPKDKFFTLMMQDSAGQGEWIDYDDTYDIRLDFLKERRLGDLMAAEQRATFSTLIENHCPVRSFQLPAFNEEVLGALLMHFTLETLFTAELLNINAFDQPAVEQGKILALHYLSEAHTQPLRHAG
jgi:glucose-6-phosphate isomerase